jgi:chromosome segregation ATPase
LENQLQTMQEENKFLREDYNEQQELADSIRKEAAQLLDDVQKLTATNKELNMQLEDSRRKAPMAQANRTPSNGKSKNGSELGQGKDPVKSSLEGHYSEYESASREFSKAIASSSDSAVLVPMKNILLNCKAITQQCEDLEDTSEEDDRQNLREAKDQLSDKLRILMAAAKQHASGSSRKSRLEDNLKDLNFAVSDLIEMMKIVRSAVVEDDQDTVKRKPTKNSPITASKIQAPPQYAQKTTPPKPPQKRESIQEQKAKASDPLPPMDMQDLIVKNFYLVLS